MECFTVIDNKTGNYPDCEEIALNEDWAKHLCYCDIDNFAITEDGSLILLDDCGKCAYCPEGRFTIVTDNNVGHKWIPVTERLPDLHTDDYEEPDGSRVQFEVSDDQWVITASGDQTKARYETGVVFQGWVGDYGQTIRNVTHWMPLPQPPKGEPQCE